MEHYQDNQVIKRRGRPQKNEEEKTRAKRGRPSSEEIRKKYLTRRRGRPTKDEAKKPRYIPLKQRETE